MLAKYKCTTQLAKLSSNDSIGRTHSKRFSIFVTTLLFFVDSPGPPKSCVMSAPTARLLLDPTAPPTAPVFVELLLRTHMVLRLESYAW